MFLTGIGKCYPILRSHKVLNNLHQAFVKAPVVMFFPGTYNEQELILFKERLSLIPEQITIIEIKVQSLIQFSDRLAT